jgi:hypothetical protein
MVSDNAILSGLEHWARACLLQIICFNPFLVYSRDAQLVEPLWYHRIYLFFVY